MCVGPLCMCEHMCTIYVQELCPEHCIGSL